MAPIACSFRSTVFICYTLEAMFSDLQLARNESPAHKTTNFSNSEAYSHNQDQRLVAQVYNILLKGQFDLPIVSIALLIASRLKTRMNSNLILQSMTIFEIFIVCLGIAQKLVSDNPFSNRWWASASRIQRFGFKEFSIWNTLESIPKYNQGQQDDGKGITAGLVHVEAITFFEWEKQLFIMTNIKQYKVSAPAKVILFGEHGVVYNKKCIATTLDKRTFGTSRTIGTGLRLQCVDIALDYDSEEYPNGYDFLEIPCRVAVDVFRMIAKECMIKDIIIVVKSDIPVGSGLGSSASFSVVIATLLLLASEKLSDALPLSDKDKYLINSLAFKAEQIIHGNPSGVDNSLCCFGGAKVYQMEKPLLNLEGYAFLSLMTAESKRFDIEPSFLLINTNVPKNTHKQVEMYKQRMQDMPLIMNHVTEGIGGISDACIDLFLNKTTDVKQVESCLSKLIVMNHSLLQAAGMSCPELDRVSLICAENNMPCKLTGAGGGGCALCLIPSGTNPEIISKVSAILAGYGMTCFETRIGVDGVRIE